MRISYSALETFEQCPQRYKFQEIDKRRTGKSKEALFGTAIHGALEYMFSRDPIFPTSEQVLAHFREHFDQKNQIAEQDRARYAQIGERMLAAFYKQNPPWNYNVVDIESRFEVTIVDKLYDTTHVLVGKIDRVDKLDDGTYEIIDYKTARKLPSQDTVNANKQLTMYQLGLQKKWPHLDPSQIKLSLYFLKANEKLTTRRTPEVLAEAEAMLLERIHAIEQKIQENSFPPTPSALCDWCGYKPICPAWRHLYEKTKGEEHALAIDDAVREYFSLKKEIDERKKKLVTISSSINEYMNREKIERVFGDTGSISRSAQERASWDGWKAKEVLAGLPILEDLLTVDTKKLATVLKTLPQETVERLKAEARTVKTFTMLKASNKKEVLSPDESLTDA